MKYVISSLLLMGVFLAGSYSYAQEHHHHHTHEKAGIEKSIIETMQGMRENLNKITNGIVQEDYQLIASAAHDITNHPGIAQEDLEALFERLGPKKEAFLACDSAVHNLADEISKAGRQENMDLVLEKYTAMIRKIVECHKNYR